MLLRLTDVRSSPPAYMGQQSFGEKFWFHEDRLPERLGSDHYLREKDSPLNGLKPSTIFSYVQDLKYGKSLGEPDLTDSNPNQEATLGDEPFQ